MIVFAKRRFYAPSGKGVRAVFKLGIDPDTGAEEVFLVGEEDFQQFIEAAAPSCDLNVIITRVRAGEVNLLKARPGFYGDSSNMPQTLQELMQTRIDAKKMYDNLSEEVRSKIEFEEFCKDAGSKDWLEKLGFNVQDVNDKESEVVKDADA